MKRLFLTLVFILFFGGLAYAGNTVPGEPFLQTADAVRGKVVAEVRCLACHHLHLTSKRIGPGLKGIYNRKPTISGVPFARWDAVALDAWLANPRAIKPNTPMNTPPVAARDRADIIAYFKKDETRSLPDL